MNKKIDLGLLNSELPGRYSGGEIFSSSKENSTIKFGLAFPDTYEIGMSHLGFKFLYTILDNQNGVSPERIFSPWVDEDKRLRESNTILKTLEKQTPINELDIIGFSLQYELSLTGVLQILDLGKISLREKDRKENDPIIICGGPLATNPAPLKPIFDIIVIGDGEIVVDKISDILVKNKNKSRKEKIELIIKTVVGAYSPRLNNIVKKSCLNDINDAPTKLNFPIPNIKAIHDRITFEIQRGCTNGCRYCQAGYIYRPLRQKSPEMILEAVQDEISKTGYDELGLLSLSSGDYYCIVPFLEKLLAICKRNNTSLSLPSLRAETLNSSIVDALSQGRPVNITVAPEAGTERLRKYINKTGDQDISLLEAVKLAGRKNINNIKAYFMIGLPTETDEDILGIVSLCKQAKDILRQTSKRSELTISVSTLVPKPWTPFQWAEQLSIAEILRKQDLLRTECKKHKLKLKYHDAESTYLEGVFARGDEKVGEALIEAYRLGAKFDAWSDQLNFDTWLTAFHNVGIDPSNYLRARDLKEELPWDFIEGMPAKKFLVNEINKANNLEETQDCREKTCNGCNMCDGKLKENIVYTLPSNPIKPTHKFTEVRGWFPTPNEAVSPSGESVVDVAQATSTEQNQIPKNKIKVINLRFTFTKLASSTLIGHIDLINIFSRALKRAKLNVKYSEGFHKHPCLVFTQPLSLGIESLHEFIDIKFDITNWNLPSKNEILESLNANLPEGVKVLDYIELPVGSTSATSCIAKQQFTINLENEELVKNISNKLNEIQISDLIVKKKSGELPVKEYINEFNFDEKNKKINITINYIGTRTINPYEVLEALSGFERAKLNSFARIRKEQAWSQP